MRTTIAALALTVAACASDDPPPPSAATPTYHQDVQPLLERSCGSCHAAGGIGPFVFDDYAQAKALSALIRDAVTTRRMPPWMPDPSCRHYVDERALSDADVDLIARWHDGGAPEGQIATAAAAAQPAPLPTPTLTLGGQGAYVPARDRPDDYRCFPLDHTFDHDTYLLGSRVVPGVRRQVHHVLLFLVGPTFASEVDRVDAASDGPGYTCFGGPGVGVPETIGAWVPGNTTTVGTGEAAIRIPKGGRLIMQLHYNTSSGPPEPDQTQVDLWLTDTPPAHLIKVKPLAHLGMVIPAGEARSVQSRIYTNRDARPWHIIGLAGHMHVLGQRIHVRALKADATTCMLDIPRWDFSWQQSYRFLPDAQVVIEPGESVRVDCTYDNSPANQPVVGGVKRESREVTWGEGTLDEMCLAYLTMIEPWSPSAEPVMGEVCPGFQACYDGCRTGPTGIAIGCALQCSAAASADRSCPQCVLQSVVACTMDACVRPIDGFLQCLDGCSADPDQRTCVARNCTSAIVALDACAAPRIGSGACDTLTAACGADL